MKPFWSLSGDDVLPDDQHITLKYSRHLRIHGALQTLVGYIFFFSPLHDKKIKIYQSNCCASISHGARRPSGARGEQPVARTSHSSLHDLCVRRATQGGVWVCRRAAPLSMCRVTRQLVSRSHRFHHLPMKWGEEPICPVQGLSIILT